MAEGPKCNGRHEPPCCQLQVLQKLQSQQGDHQKTPVPLMRLQQDLLAHLSPCWKALHSLAHSDTCKPSAHLSIGSTAALQQLPRQRKGIFMSMIATAVTGHIEERWGM